MLLYEWESGLKYCYSGSEKKMYMWNPQSQSMYQWKGRGSIKFLWQADQGSAGQGQSEAVETVMVMADQCKLGANLGRPLQLPLRIGLVNQRRFYG